MLAMSTASQSGIFGMGNPAEGCCAACMWLAEQVAQRARILLNDKVRGKLASLASEVPEEGRRAWAERLVAAPDAAPEWMALLEHLSVHETYFFRDPGQFDFVRRTALAAAIEQARASGRHSLSLWSAACSTGEEAYSLAILALEALADAGELDLDSFGQVRWRTPWRVDVLGSDVSHRAVAIARSGHYRDHGIGSFRDLPKDYWRYFERLPNGWRVKPHVGAMVRFQRCDLMAPMPPVRGFDLVFCRNVLIYFTPPGRQHVFRQIHQSLAPGGHAVFGPTEIPDDPALFSTVWGPATVIYRRSG